MDENQARDADTGPACTLNAGELTQRRGEIRRLFERALIERRRTATGLELRFRKSDETDASIARLVRQEQECCSFLTLNTVRGSEDIRLTVTAPAGADAFFDGFLVHPL